MNNKAKFLTIGLLVLISAIAFAQNSGQQLLCFGGTKIITVIRSEQSADKIPEMENDNFVMLPFRTSYLLSGTDGEKIKYPILNSISPEKGFIKYAEIGYSLGVGKFDIDFFKLNAILAYKINPYISLGLGTGLRYALDVSDALIPFFVDFRANLNKKNIPVYLAVDWGYSLDVTSDYKTEGFYLLINPSAGINFKLSDKIRMNVGLGYDFRKFKLNYSGYNVPHGSTVNITGISVNTGISF